MIFTNIHQALPPSFFARPTLTVARELLGKFLVHRTARGKLQTGMITEVEAYDGHRDRGSHASRGLTRRNAPMFGPPGGWYIYLVYGMYEMLNIVTREEGYPAAVLLRGVQGLSGPGRLTKTYGITRRFSGRPARRATGLWIEDRGLVIPARRIVRTPRIGVDYAGRHWAQKPWRFVMSAD